MHGNLRRPAAVLSATVSNPLPAMPADRVLPAGPLPPAMMEPVVIGDWPSLLEVLRNRVAALGVTYEKVDEVCGFRSGYVRALLSDPPNEAAAGDSLAHSAWRACPEAGDAARRGGFRTPAASVSAACSAGYASPGRHHRIDARTICAGLLCWVRGPDGEAVAAAALGDCAQSRKGEMVAAAQGR